MTRIVQQHPTLAARLLPRLVVTTLVVGALLLGVRTAHAAFTTPPCLAAKLKAAGALRACRAAQGAKQILGKVGDLAKCEAKFQEKLAKLDAKAAKARVDCRYRDYGDGTVTDFDTGLQWEQKTTVVGSGADFADPHDVDNTYTWTVVVGETTPNGTAFTDFLPRLNGASSDGVTLSGCFASHCDWRLPTIVELRGIVDLTTCGLGTPCIDPIFGPTVPFDYWSATTFATDPLLAWNVAFDFDNVGNVLKFAGTAVRAVRTGS